MRLTAFLMIAASVIFVFTGWAVNKFWVYTPEDYSFGWTQPNGYTYPDSPVFTKDKFILSLGKNSVFVSKGDFYDYIRRLGY